MPVQFLHFLFSLANQFSVGVSAMLALVWFVALGIHLRKKFLARESAVRESFATDNTELMLKARP